MNKAQLKERFIEILEDAMEDDRYPADGIAAALLDEIEEAEVRDEIDTYLGREEGVDLLSSDDEC